MLLSHCADNATDRLLQSLLVSFCLKDVMSVMSGNSHLSISVLASRSN